MNVEDPNAKSPKNSKDDKKAVFLQGGRVSSKKAAQPLFDEIVRRLKGAEMNTVVTQSIEKYAASRSSGRPVKVLGQVVPDLVFREIQEVLKAKPIWFRRLGETKANPATGYWYTNRGQWWGGLWNALRPAFEDLMTAVAPPAPPWNVQVQRLIEKVLVSALKEPGRGPTVLQVPPGLGKTTGTIEALCRPAPGVRALPKGRRLRILWFVRESRVTEKGSGQARASLGSEVLAEFKRRGALAQVIESQGDAAGTAAQRDRGQWQKKASQPEVRILAHAYLPLMFRSARTGAGNVWLDSLRKRADLVVIDEDPVQSLVFTDTDLPDLPLWPELVDLMEAEGVLRRGEGALRCPLRPSEVDGQKEAYWEPRREAPDQLFRGTYQRMTLQDHDAWMRLWAATLTAPARKVTARSSSAAWDRFRAALFSICRDRWSARLPEPLSDARVISEHQVLEKKLADFVRELRVDLLACLDGASSTLRFGLLWVPDPDKPAEVQLRLRFSCLKPFAFTGSNRSKAPLPVVILDAYADLCRYKKVLGPTTALEALGHDAAFELRVEQVNPAKELQKFTVTTGFAQRHLLRLMTESTLFLLDEHQRLPRRVLFLGPQAVTSHQHVQRRIAPVINAQESYQFAHRWLHYLTPVQESTDTSQRFQSAHWFAGRGRNQFAGSDVVALCPPRYPRQYQDLLAAVAPQTMLDEAERQRLSRHDETAELLQMLHRGRQVLWRLQRPGKAAPRVVILFDLEGFENDLKGKAKVRPLESGTVDLPKHPNQMFSYNQLGGLPLKDGLDRDHPEERGKLELTKLVGVGVLMELLGRVNKARPRRRVQSPPELALPEGWFPERLLVRLGILGQARPDTESEGALIRVYLDQLELPTATPHSAPGFRFIAAALQRAGLWETMPLGKKVDPQAWAPPGTETYLKPQLQAFFEKRFGQLLVVERHPLRELGVIWRLAQADLGDIQTWSHLQIQRLQRQDRGGQEKTQGRRRRSVR